MDLFSRLSRQALGRELSPCEVTFAQQLEGLFAASVHDPAAIAAALNQMNAKRPSGEEGPWDASVIMDELQALNASLDQAYASGTNVVNAGAN